MTAFWIILALKATVWASVTTMAVLVLPAQFARPRRVLSLVGLWGLWVVPWLELPWTLDATLPQVEFSIADPTKLWTILAAIWLAGSVLLLLRLLREFAGVLRLVRGSVMSHLKLMPGLDVRFSTQVEGPCMAGWWHPCVLLPPGAAMWPEATLEAALRHERQHALQRDGLHRACAALLGVVFWWNPVIHLLRGVYEAETEVCCDLAASGSNVSRREYGEMLLAHVCGNQWNACSPAFARRRGLRHRIERLLLVPTSSHWAVSARWFGAVLLVATAGVLAGSVHVLSPAMPVGSDLKSEALIRLNADPFPGSP